MTDWTPQTETFSTDGPTCPHCGRVYTPDEPHYFDERGYTQETCDECERPFKVEVQHSVSWSCEVIDDSSSQTIAEETKR